MEEENRPADSKSISQAAGTNENHQIPTPPSEEDPAGHGTESIREGSAPGDTGKDVQEQDGEIVVVEEKTASSEDDESEAGSDTASIVLPDGTRVARPFKWDYPYLTRPAPAPLGPPVGMANAQPVSLLEATLSKREELKRKHDEYILLLEDRITRVENRITKFLKKPHKKFPPAPKYMFVPELRELSWKDWLQTIGKSASEGHSTIEVLVEVPASRGRELGSENDPKYQENDLRSPEQLQGVQRSASRLPEDVADLPERMRINTGILLTNLERDVMDKGAIDTIPPQVLRRPYKALVYYKDAILERIDELKNTLDPEALERVQKRVDNPEKMELPTLREADNEFHYLLFSFLGKFMKTYLEPILQRIPEQSRVQFHELWFIFEPGHYVYVKEKDCPQQIWRVVQTMGGNRFLRKPSRATQGPPPGRGRYRSPSYSRSRSPSPMPVRVRRGSVSPVRGSEDELASSNYPLNEFSPFLLDCYFIDYDGFQFKPVYRRFEIQKFEDNVPIKLLNVVPLDKAVEAGLVEPELRRKIGEQYLECIQPTHRFFDGRSLDRNSDGDVLYLQESDDYRTQRRAFPEMLEGKVMVDLTTSAQANPTWRPFYEELEYYKTPSNELQGDPPRGRGLAELLRDDYIIDQRRREDFLDKEMQKFKDWNSDSPSKPDGDELMLLPDRVFAFILRTRRWACIPLGFNEKNEPLLRKVFPEDDAWNDLQLPGGDDGHKHIIQSLIEKHFAKDMAIDLVRDKGRGLIILLHGAPGVGKTSTAECVAAANGKPLLPITCGDLGLSPKEVEENLEFHFRLAQTWDCVLLLDEADVFLARRTVEDVSRNALVSVFLRILEYYEGILFLTTNRVGTLDEAFRSRIHMSLYYPMLSQHQTKAIWKILCRRARKQQERLDIDEEKILDYAMDHFDDLKKAGGRGAGWNGRQIKNAFMSAIALAHYRIPEGERVKLKVSHFEKVARASKEFDEYLTRAHGGRDQQAFARFHWLRDDDFPIHPGDSDGGAGMGHGGGPPRNLYNPNMNAQTQQFGSQNAFGVGAVNPYAMQGMQGGFPQQQMGMGMPGQQFFGNPMMGGMPNQGQFYGQGQGMQGNMGQQNMPQNMASGQQGQMGGNQMGGQATAGAQQSNPQQQQQGQQGFGSGFVQGQGSGFGGGQS